MAFVFVNLVFGICFTGKYSNVTGLNSSCTAVCANGTRCPFGTALPAPCGDPSVYVTSRCAHSLPRVFG